jgi:broad specificity phosphatase PhoE
LERAAEALKVLAQEAKDSDGCVVAVTHSAYLKILLAMALDEPLIEAATRKVNNGSINVLDIKKDGSRRLGPKPKLLGGPLSLVPTDFDLEIPNCNVVRINETRHLSSIL